MARLIRTTKADADLLGIWDYIAPHSVRAAERLIDRISQCCQHLATYPLVGTPCSDLADRLPSDMRQFSVGDFVIFYRPISDGVVVYRILHGRRDIPAVFRAEPLDEESEP